jgi:hypothetical protein
MTNRALSLILGVDTNGKDEQQGTVGSSLESGGEGGIRTLGTGVSPYNGLASVSIFAVCNHVKSSQSGQRLGNG